MFSIEHYGDLICSRKISDAVEYRSLYTPNIIHKFVRLSSDEYDNNRRFYTLENNYLWAAPAKQQNDPYEFCGMYLDKNKLFSIGFTSEVIEAVETKLHNSFNIISFCGNALNNMQMWYNYANKHEGFCLEYRVCDKRHIRSVIYEPKRIPICNILVNMIKCAEQFNKTGDKMHSESAELYSTLLREIYYVKHISWKNENEYRIIHPSRDDEEDRNGENVSADELGLTLECIYSGFNCDPGNINMLRTISEKINVPLKQCHISKTEFAVFEE